jgi:hypothetical protein
MGEDDAVLRFDASGHAAHMVVGLDYDAACGVGAADGAVSRHAEPGPAADVISAVMAHAVHTTPNESVLLLHAQLRARNLTHPSNRFKPISYFQG